MPRCNCPTHGGRKKKPSAKAKNGTLRDQFTKTNLDLFLLGIVFAFYNGWNTKALASSAQLFDDVEVEQAEALSSTASSVVDTDIDIEEVDDPVYAVLFPWFTQTIAIFIYYVITRYLKILPYTASVFILGTCIGYFTSSWHENAIAYSASIWLGINGQVILLVFLPGLIFHDSFTINVHLFFQGKMINERCG